MDNTVNASMLNNNIGIVVVIEEFIETHLGAFIEKSPRGFYQIY